MKTSNKSSWGGTRPGSGRKPKLKYETRELFYQKIDEQWDQLVNSLITKAIEGDKEILKWILDQRIGKAAQSMQMSTDPEAPIPILTIVKSDE